MRRAGPAVAARWAIAAALCAVAGLLAYWRVSGPGLPRATLRIGYAVEAPFAFLDAQGRVTGESPEVAKAVLKRMGARRVEWRQTEFGSLIAELESGQIDVIAAGLFITRERAERVSFSQPTFHVRQALLVPKGNPARLHSYEQAVAAGVKVAVVGGSLEEALLRRLGAGPGQVVPAPDSWAGRAAVESGVAGGLALSAPSLRWMLKSRSSRGVEIAEPFEQPKQEKYQGYGGFAFRKSDTRLRTAWNAAQLSFVGSPEHRRLAGSFGFGEAEMPGSVHIEEILAEP